MKGWKCPKCFREHKSKKDVKLVFCKCCLIEMKELNKEGDNGKQN